MGSPRKEYERPRDPRTPFVSPRPRRSPRKGRTTSESSYLIETPSDPAPILDLGPWRGYLVAEGYRPEVDDDGDLRFRHAGRTIYLLLDAADRGYFRLSLPGVWECDGTEEEQRALAAANAVQRDLKAARCVLVDGLVWVSVELFLEPPKSIRAVFRRCLDTIGSAAWQVRERMRSAAA